MIWWWQNEGKNLEVLFTGQWHRKFKVTMKEMRILMESWENQEMGFGGGRGGERERESLAFLFMGQCHRKLKVGMKEMRILMGSWENKEMGFWLVGDRETEEHDISGILKFYKVKPVNVF